MSHIAPVRRHHRASALAVLLVLSVAACKSSADPADSTHAANNPFAQLSMEEQMKAMMELATPGAEHQRLQQLVGDWDLTIKMRFGPKEPWQEMPGTIEAKSVLGGRYVVQHYQSTMMGQPFEGIGTLGYDRLKKRYTSSWADSMSTWIVRTEGQAEGNAIDYRGMMVDSITPHGRPMRTVERLADPDHWTTAMYDTIEGESVQVMEIHATRRK
ncbi:MAG: DUF1579 domain-containing protein [Planctomycetes bacterium]|nr:DUF1579 domain-containing protein [Planctomycetota bacterium]